MDADLQRIEQALLAAQEAAARFTPGRIASEKKGGGDPVTQADLLLDKVLKEALLGPSEGWLSEETADDLSRLGKKRVWIVDPLDGTREFVEGIPEWCISVALVEEGCPTAAGICNPAAGQIFLGSRSSGVTLNGRPVRVGGKADLKGARILASRSEVRRGEWKRFEGAGFEIVPMGSVAYKLALVAAGLADGMFTLVPKNEWDVAAGVCLVEAAGGRWEAAESRRQFNQPNPLLKGLWAANERLLLPLKKISG
ncbi:MAG TPA: 3'(2'),5'-bisphosphate nucleotidase CysQ [Anaerohalosphaeraceae bacterium]|nr:3'(2'),5'-bisphosphate nucleotidase CysQ [Anaerohalosphaeraceae bacterium]HOL90013.1 3'(2'),5'-bisphosphate nucleotidase CysQ [Anaerohalosphaeraceae bacterium]HPP57340.1 3'(2'),5'-bisphosphate nucleotidase CysQ [Anaerohalosphaeraceae bacterium]